MVNNNEIEIWRDIPDFEGLYQISNLGRVKSLPRMKKLYSKLVFVPGGIRRHGMDKDGYCIIPLNKNGKKFIRKIHRLVAQAFIPNPDNKEIVDHIDCDRTNNIVSNLRWVTTKENNEYAILFGNMKRDISSGRFVKHEQ